MKVRWALEHGFGDDPPGTVYLSLVNTNNDDVLSGVRYPTEDAAKATADPDGELTWKPAPAAWQPDTYLVSSYYEDEGYDR